MARTLPSQPIALLFAPMIYVAWADGDLSSRELEIIGQRFGAHLDLPVDCRELIAGWLDPDDPPSAGELAALLERIRSSTTAMPQRERLDFRSIGAELARSAGHVPGDPELAALAELEDAIGVAVNDRASSLLWPVRPPPAPRLDAPAFDVHGLTDLLDGDRAELRRDILAFLANLEPGESARGKPGYRAAVHGWLNEIAARGWGSAPLPTSVGGRGDLLAFLTAFETLALGDLSLLVKFGVQFGLFGLGIAMLGTDDHHRKYLPAAGSLELAGCFAMTETGHGSNVAELETTATYDAEREQFVINTPTPRARKDYIGNAANYARAAIVFAQLETPGQSHGVHAFMVSLRDDEGRVLPGILIEECGEKLGLEGVDNGRISFNGVLVARDALLDRFATLAPDGTYDSPIASPGRRFFTMLGTLVGGRIAVASAAVTASKLALTIATRYALRRRQFGPSGVAELPLIEYPHHRRRLLPALAKSFALHFAVRQQCVRFARVHTEARRRDVLPSDPELETSAAALKAIATWHASATIAECREACGGRGYLADARFGVLKADTEVFTTFEGDNTVLLQLVARSLLSDHARGMRDLGVVGLARYVARQVRSTFDRNPYVTRRTDSEHLRDADVQNALFAAREKDLLHSLAKRLERRLDEGQGGFEALTECQEHSLSLGRAHAERLALAAITQVEHSSGSQSAMLGQLRSLYALHHLESDRAWFLENGYFEAAKAMAIRSEVDELCAEIAPQAPHLIDAFDIPDAVIRAPIGLAAALVE